MKYKINPKAIEHFNCNSSNSRALAKMWKDFVKPEERMKSEGPFLLKKLPPGSRVLEACMGSFGATSVFLARHGFAVSGNEFDLNFRKEIEKEMEKTGLAIPITSYDWRTFSSNFPPAAFDAVLCLGNSLVYMYGDDRIAALKNFAAVLAQSGTLVIDVRNNDRLLANREGIVASGSIPCSGKYVYCGGDSVHARLLSISDEMLVFEYEHRKSGSKARLSLYPIKRMEMEQLLRTAGFGSMELFSDYVPGLNPNADFFQFVCKK